MNGYPNWIEHVRSSHLFNWHNFKGFEQYTTNNKHFRSNPSYSSLMLRYNNTESQPGYPERFYIDENFKVVRSGDIVKETSSLICLDWNEIIIDMDKNFINIGNHPVRISLHDITKYHKDGVPFRKNTDKPAIKIDEIKVIRRDYRGCMEHQIPWYPGPSATNIINYREYWDNGKFVKNTWDFIIYDWGSIMFPFWNTFSTYGGPNYPLYKNQDTRLSETENEFWTVLKTLKEPVSPFSNQFFNHTTDEFRVLDIIQRDYKK
jgi:hypothetical protein